MKKILLLGGTGVIGSEFIRNFNNKHNIFTTSRKKRDFDKVIHGDAKNDTFLKRILTEKWDVIIDLLIYSKIEFENRYKLLLKSTKNYIFVSTSRVYNDSSKEINERSLRLIDSNSKINSYSPDDYSLIKAYQENLLLNNDLKNFTIVRPYITFNKDRLQLIHLEKEFWLQRLISNKELVLPREVLDKETTLTSGKTVAAMINKIINKDPNGAIFNLTTNQTYSWNIILKKYIDIFNTYNSKNPQFRVLPLKDYFNYYGNNNQITYDRFFNRRFEANKLFEDIISNNNELELLGDEFKNFLQNPKFNYITPRFNGISDKIINSFDYKLLRMGTKNAIVYLMGRFF